MNRADGPDPLANALIRIKHLEDERLNLDLQIDNLQEEVGKLHVAMTIMAAAFDDHEGETLEFAHV